MSTDVYMYDNDEKWQKVMEKMRGKNFCQMLQHFNEF